MLLKTITRYLPCKLTDAELRQRGGELADVIQGIDSEDRRQADVKAQLKARMAELESKRSQIAIIIRRQEEDREIECDVMAHPTKNNMVEVVRRDTGEVVEVRHMTDEERQRSLPMEAAATR